MTQFSRHLLGSYTATLGIVAAVLTVSACGGEISEPLETETGQGTSSSSSSSSDSSVETGVETDSFSVTSVEITPDPAFNDDVLNCAATLSNPDQLDVAVSYLWTRLANGEEIGEGESLNLMEHHLRPGAAVRCGVTAAAGAELAQNAATITLGNRDPVIDELFLSSDEVQAGEELTCYGIASDPDREEPVLTYSWSTGETTSRIVVPGDTTSPGDLIECTVTATDAAGATATDSIAAVVRNSPPEILAVEVMPGTARVGDEVRCEATAIDADEEELSYAYSWSNGETGPAMTLTGENSTVGEAITCSVTVVDPHGAEASGTSSPGVLVENSPPVVDSVAVTPPTGRVGDTITCAATASDPDLEDASITYAWTNGELGPSMVLTASNSSVGEEIFCIATATDPHGASSELTSSSGVTVLNSDPVVDAAAITPPSPNTTDILGVSISATDPDGDDLTFEYTWTVVRDGVASPPVVGPTLDSSQTQRRDLVDVRIAISDGHTTVHHEVGPVEIGNAAPSSPEIEITPDVPVLDEELICEVTADSVDPDGDDITYSFSWTVDGSPFTSARTEPRRSVVDPTFIEGTHEWICTVLASDGDLDSEPAIARAYIWDGEREFTTCSRSGFDGPSAEQCSTEYLSTPLEGEVEVIDGVQRWVVPASGTYVVDALGAAGGGATLIGAGSAGEGAIVSSELILEEGDVLNILVGQQGTGGSRVGGGGGGTFIWLDGDDEPLVAAGGGGGAGFRSAGAISVHGLPGQDSLDGADGIQTMAPRAGGTGHGGVDGEGGVHGTYTPSLGGGAGGAGWLTNGSTSSFGSCVTALGGQGPLESGLGGRSFASSSGTLDGGYGGGGGGRGGCTWAGGGGGGGYSGGGGGGGDAEISSTSSSAGGGGGGGSYSVDPFAAFSLGGNDGHGAVFIDRR